MPDDLATAERVRAACALAHEALVDLQRIDDPTLWRGPAASAFRRELGEHRVLARRALGSAAAAADALVAGPPTGGGG